MANTKTKSAKPKVNRASSAARASQAKGNYIAEWRTHRGFCDKAKLAEVAGISRPELSRLESGKRDYNGRNLRKLAAVLKCTPADLIGRHPNDTGVEILQIYRSAPLKERPEIERHAAEFFAILLTIPPKDRSHFLRRVRALTTGQNN